MQNNIAVATIKEGSPTAPLTLRGPIEQVIKQAKEIGYNAIEIHLIDTDDFDPEQVAKQCQENDIKIASIVTGQIYVRRGYCLTHEDADNRQKAISELKEYIDIAAQLNAQDGIVLGWLRGNRPTDKKQADLYDKYLVDNLTEVGKYAASKGQYILLEVINRYEMNIFNTARETVDFIEKYNLPNTLIHLDSFHMNIEEANFREAILACGDKLGYFHFADNNRHYPGAGTINFPEIVEALSDANYKGSLSLECLPLPDGLTAAKKGFTNIKKYVANVKK